MIQQQQYKDFIKAVTDTIEGDWVLVGGALIALLNPDSRVTSDIDLCPMDELTNERRLGLMKLAQSSGLSIEAINPSADFFLRQIPNWKASLVHFVQGKKGSLYRPSLELYIRMKCERLSESDFGDCLAFLDWHVRTKAKFDRDKILTFVRDRLESASEPQKKKFIELLISKFSQNP